MCVTTAHTTFSVSAGRPDIPGIEQSKRLPDTRRNSFAGIPTTPGMEEQERVAEFVRTNEMSAPPAYRLLDLVSELGEVAKDATESTDYGESPESLELSPDEVGDVLFALLALAEAADIDAGDALDEALSKYDDRIDVSGSASSGSHAPGDGLDADRE